MGDHPARIDSDVRTIRNAVRNLLHIMKINLNTCEAHEEKYATATTAKKAIEEYYYIEKARRDLTEAILHVETAYTKNRCRSVRVKNTSGGHDWIRIDEKWWSDKVDQYFPKEANTMGVKIDRTSLNEYKDIAGGYNRPYRPPSDLYRTEWVRAESERR